MQASEAAFMQRGDIIRLHANIIHGMLSIYPYHIFRIPADTQTIMGIPIDDFESALINLERRGLVKGKTVTINSRICWLAQFRKAA